MKEKLSYQSLPRFTRNPSYRINVDWHYLESTISHWSNDNLCPIDLNPDFQRDYVWTLEQQIKYVEYALKGGSSGREIYFNCVGWQTTFKGPFVIVDGKQRLHAVREFLANKIPVFGDYYHKDIEGRLPTTAFFYFSINDLPTRKEVLQWYLEMNTGGTIHTQKEIDKVKQMVENIV